VTAPGICALERSKRYVGVKEEPPGSNRGPLIDRWLRDAGVPPGNPWCMAFVRAMFRECGRILGGGASVGRFEQWAHEHGELVKRPFRGDVVCYRFDSDDWPDHVGLVDRVLAVRWLGGRFVGTIRTVEGNTAHGNDANGGQVQVRYRSALRCTFARIT
jgi:hypothetical protein